MGRLAAPAVDVVDVTIDVNKHVNKKCDKNVLMTFLSHFFSAWKLEEHLVQRYNID